MASTFRESEEASNALGLRKEQADPRQGDPHEQIRQSDEQRQTFRSEKSSVTTRNPRAICADKGATSPTH